MKTRLVVYKHVLKHANPTYLGSFLCGNLGNSEKFPCLLAQWKYAISTLKTSTFHTLIRNFTAQFGQLLMLLISIEVVRPVFLSSRTDLEHGPPA